MSPHPGYVIAASNALTALRTAGARVTDLTLRDQTVLIGKDPPPGTTATFASRSAFDFPVSIDRYLRRRRGAPRDIAALRDALATLTMAGRSDPVVLKDVDTFITNRVGAATDPRFAANGRFRDRFVEERIGAAFDCTASTDCVDILVYPSVQQPAASVDKGPDTAGTHRLAAYSGYPAVAVPIGMVDTGIGPRPVSLELMGRPGSDQALLAIAAQWRRLLAPRRRRTRHRRCVAPRPTPIAARECS